MAAPTLCPLSDAIANNGDGATPIPMIISANANNTLRSDTPSDITLDPSDFVPP
jgi:hypothetical protein